MRSTLSISSTKQSSTNRDDEFALIPGSIKIRDIKWSSASSWDPLEKLRDFKLKKSCYNAQKTCWKPTKLSVSEFHNINFHYYLLSSSIIFHVMHFIVRLLFLVVHFQDLLLIIIELFFHVKVEPNRKSDYPKNSLNKG